MRSRKFVRPAAAPSSISLRSLGRSASPGGVDTARILRRFESREAANRARGPAYLLGRPGRADEIAAGALFLASDESSFMTGADLLLDGGYLAFKGTIDKPA